MATYIKLSGERVEIKLDNPPPAPKLARHKTTGLICLPEALSPAQKAIGDFEIITLKVGA